MTVARMPGRNGGARIDTRNCYMSDEEVEIRERAVMAFEKVEDEFSIPALAWWAGVAILAVVTFFAGIFCGSRS